MISKISLAALTLSGMYPITPFTLFCPLAQATQFPLSNLQAGVNAFNEVPSEEGSNCLDNKILQQSEKIHAISSNNEKSSSLGLPKIRPYGDFTDEDTMKKVKCMAAKFPEGEIVYANKLANIVEKAFQSESARMLLGKVLAEGTLFVIPGDVHSAPQGASWRVEERIISILNSENSNRKLGHFLFEASNALHTKAQLKLRDEALSGDVGKDSYAKRWERIEYEASKKFSSTILSCIKKDKWPKEVNLDIPLLISMAPDWNRFWTLISKTSHPDEFRNDWVSLYKEKYCKKHSKSSDCI